MPTNHIIHCSTTPQVLFLGNGINLLADRDSWKKLLLEICDNEEIKQTYLSDPSCHSYVNIPMSVQAFLAGEGGSTTLSQCLKDKCQKSKYFIGSVDSKIQRQCLEKLLSIDFDAILTTNYSYELECVCKGKKEVSVSEVKKYSTATVGNVEPKFLLRSFNEIPFRGNTQRIFHIHGEARKYTSIVLGSYLYGRLLSKIIPYADKRWNNGHISEYDNWVDLFLQGDVYFLGFGLDFAESDIWWLIERKFRGNTRTPLNKFDQGNIYFYDVDDYLDHNARKTMLNIMGFSAENFGFYKRDAEEKECSVDYAAFYKKVICDIESRVNASRNK